MKNQSPFYPTWRTDKKIFKPPTFYRRCISIILSISLTFFIRLFHLASFLIVTSFIYTVTLSQVLPWNLNTIEKNKITLFLNPALSEQKIQALQEKLDEMKEVKKIYYITKSEGIKQFLNVLNIQHVIKITEKTDWSYLEKELFPIIEITPLFTDLKWKNLKILVKNLNALPDIVYLGFNEQDFKVIYDRYHWYQTLQFYTDIGLILLSVIFFTLHLCFLNKYLKNTSILLKSLLYFSGSTVINSIALKHYQAILQSMFHLSTQHIELNQNSDYVMIKNSLIVFSLGVLWTNMLLALYQHKKIGD